MLNMFDTFCRLRDKHKYPNGWLFRENAFKQLYPLLLLTISNEMYNFCKHNLNCIPLGLVHISKMLRALCVGS